MAAKGRSGSRISTLRSGQATPSRPPPRHRAEASREELGACCRTFRLGHVDQMVKIGRRRSGTGRRNSGRDVGIRRTASGPNLSLGHRQATAPKRPVEPTVRHRTARIKYRRNPKPSSGSPSLAEPVGCSRIRRPTQRRGTFRCHWAWSPSPHLRSQNLAPVIDSLCQGGLVGGEDRAAADQK